MSVRRRLGALENMIGGGRREACGLEPNCFEKDTKRPCHYDHVNDVLTIFPEGTRPDYRTCLPLDWEMTRAMLSPPDFPWKTTTPRIVYLDGSEGRGGE
jgi:hypothetical protein